MNSLLIRLLLIVFCGLPLCIGCSHAPGLEGLVPVEGIVTFNGERVADAFVLFKPVGQGQAASGTTDANGQFALMTFNPDDGARPGEYVVMVTKTETRGEIRIERPAGTNQKIVHDDREIINHLPEKYASTASTDLKIPVPENGNMQITLALIGEADLTPRKISDMKRSM